MREPLLYTINDAADVLSIGRTKFYELLDSGQITTVTIGRRRLVPRQHLIDFIATLPTEPPPNNASTYLHGSDDA